MVKSDTISSIAEQFNIKEDQIKAANPVDNRGFLYVGQSIFIPVTYFYTPPITSSLVNVMNNSITDWRNPFFELYIWDKIPNVLIFDTINFSFQSQMFKRLAFFVEKKDFIGSIYSLDEIEDERGWNGHDYNTDDLARFFNKVDFEGHTITSGEEILLDIILKNDLLTLTELGYVSMGGAVISCSRDSQYNQRKTILRHEAFHGLFFTSHLFREHVKSVWDELDDISKEIWTLYLEVLEYDTSDPVLIINEFMAYMLQLSEDETYYYLNELVWFRLWEYFPDQRESFESFFSKSKTPYRAAIKKLRAYTESMLIE